MSLMSAMTYISMGFQNGTHTLTDAEIDAGIITPMIMQRVMGVGGGYLLITMITMALMSTGSGEVMAVSSILVYDIYKVYINPFRKNTHSTLCLLCGRGKTDAVPMVSNTSKKTDDDICQCPSSLACLHCVGDIKLRQEGSHRIIYSCPTHGLYRHYEDILLRYKSWCIMWVVLLIIPYGLVILSTGVDLNWVVMTSQSIMSPFLIPLLLTITWSKSTASATIAGSVCGLVGSITANLIAASRYEGGLSNFMVNTAQDYSLLAGLCTGLLVSTIVTIVTSLCTNQIRTDGDSEAVWAKTLSIDNPLNPWRAIYQEELDEIGADIKIDSSVMSKILHRAKLTAYIACSIGFVIFIVIIPSIMLGIDILSFAQFSGWIKFCQIWCMISAVFVVVAPPVEEVLQIKRRRSQNTKRPVNKRASDNLDTQF
ncbi:hypothetical protein ScPMuIL_011343 [Solemya velum]